MIFMNVSLILGFGVIPNSESLHLVLQPVCPMLCKIDDTLKMYMFANALIITLSMLWAVMND